VRCCPRQHDGGDFAIELEDFAASEQEYLTNTAILRTVLRDRHGGAWKSSTSPRAGARTTASTGRSA
jgi:hypothetical protein